MFLTIIICGRVHLSAVKLTCLIAGLTEVIKRELNEDETAATVTDNNYLV